MSSLAPSQASCFALPELLGPKPTAEELVNLPEEFLQQQHPNLSLDRPQIEINELIPGQMWTIDGVLSVEECNAWIEASKIIGDTVGFQDFSPQPTMRTNHRLIFQDPTLAQKLWDLLQDVPFPRQVFTDGKLNGSSPRNVTGISSGMRLYRYDQGEYFKPHYDGAFGPDEEGSYSEFTLVLYLNDEFTGGATRFLEIPEWEGQPRDVWPKRGSALLFRQRGLLHEGLAVEEGHKYIIQTGIMYEKSVGSGPHKLPPIFSYNAVPEGGYKVPAKCLESVKKYHEELDRASALQQKAN